MKQQKLEEQQADTVRVLRDVLDALERGYHTDAHYKVVALIRTIERK